MISLDGNNLIDQLQVTYFGVFQDNVLTLFFNTLYVEKRKVLKIIIIIRNYNYG